MRTKCISSIEIQKMTSWWCLLEVEWTAFLRGKFEAFLHALLNGRLRFSLENVKIWFSLRKSCIESANGSEREEGWRGEEEGEGIPQWSTLGTSFFLEMTRYIEVINLRYSFILHSIEIDSLPGSHLPQEWIDRVSILSSPNWECTLVHCSSTSLTCTRNHLRSQEEDWNGYGREDTVEGREGISLSALIETHSDWGNILHYECSESNENHLRNTDERRWITARVGGWKRERGHHSFYSIDIL